MRRPMLDRTEHSKKYAGCCGDRFVIIKVPFHSEAIADWRTHVMVIDLIGDRSCNLKKWKMKSSTLIKDLTFTLEKAHNEKWKEFQYKHDIMLLKKELTSRKVLGFSLRSIWEVVGHQRKHHQRYYFFLFWRTKQTHPQSLVCMGEIHTAYLRGRLWHARGRANCQQVPQSNTDREQSVAITSFGCKIRINRSPVEDISAQGCTSVTARIFKTVR